MAKLVHVQIHIKKLDTLSDEEFHIYWRDPHPKIWLRADILKKNVIKYSQFHVDQKTSGQLTAAGLPMAEFDGGVNIWGRSLEELMAVFHDEKYLKVVVPDEEKFLNRGKIVMMLGWDEDLKS